MKITNNSIELNNKDLNNKETMNNFNKLMDKIQDSYVNEIKKLSVELDITEDCAMNVWYLRTRSRWTQELENELIKLCESGAPVNMNEFGCKDKNGHIIY